MYSLPGACESAEEEAGESAGGGGRGGSMVGGDDGGEVGGAGAGRARLARGERGALAGLLSELRRRELGRLPPESEPAEPPRPYVDVWGVCGDK